MQGQPNIFSYKWWSPDWEPDQSTYKHEEQKTKEQAISEPLP